MTAFVAFLVASLTLPTAGCDNRVTLDMNVPFVISVAWNVPTADLYVRGLTRAIEDMGGHVFPGGGPSSSMFAPPGAQVLHLADGHSGAGRCDVEENILAWTDTLTRDITVCHNPAVKNAVNLPPAQVALGALVTMRHELKHRGGYGGGCHWRCDDLGGEHRVMGSARRCQVVGTDGDDSEADVAYGCAGGLILNGRCADPPPFPAGAECVNTDVQ